MRKCWLSPVGPWCTLRYTSSNVLHVTHKAPSSPTYAQRKPSIRETIALHNTAKAIISTAPARERKSKQRQTRVASEMTRRPWRDFVRAHCCYLCAYIRISGKCNIGSRAFNHLAYVAMHYVMNTHGVCRKNDMLKKWSKRLIATHENF